MVLFLVPAAPGQIPQAPAPPPAQLLSPQQLDNLVSPIALYPDPLVSEVLAAATYPMEIAEAHQFVVDHKGWQPAQLMDEAKKQTWDPSVQGLVAFSQVLDLLAQNMAWTTQLGNAFLAQQPDVMQAVQRMRAQAQSRGTLGSTPQQTVATQNENGQSAITIQPTNPDVWYAPYYNPAYVWGAPVYGLYPPLIYPGIDVGFVWGPGIDIGLFFGGWGGWAWGGIGWWGWWPNWFGGVIVINHSFFHRYGFGHFHGEPFGTSVWEHNPTHRLGVPYGSEGVANRFAGRPGVGTIGGIGRGPTGGVPGGGGFRPVTPAPRATAPAAPAAPQRAMPQNHSVFGGYQNGAAARTQSDHGFSSMGAGRTFGGGGGGGSRGRR